MKRELGRFELAETLSDEYSAFNVAGILFLEDGPAADVLRKALDKLQRRHPLLQVKIIREGKKYHFDSGSVPSIPLDVKKCRQNGRWEPVVEAALNTRLDSSSGPLIKATYLLDPLPGGKSELILICHHSIADTASLLNLYKELLSLCAKLENGEALNDIPPLPLLPPEEFFFPSAYRGIRRKIQTVSHMFRQMGDEMGYRLGMRGKPKPEIPLQGHCRILPMEVPESKTETIVQASRKRKISLNSLFSAVMLQAASKKFYQGLDLPLRYFTFANLRPYLKPPVPDENMGSYHSMLRATLTLKKNQDLWDLAERINCQTRRILKRGDKFISPLLSPQMMRLFIRLKSMRMGTTALSYHGSIRFPSSFGKTRVTSVRGYISNLSLGPLFTASARIFKKKLLWDFLYMDSDMDFPSAQEIASEILGGLEAACRKP